MTAEELAEKFDLSISAARIRLVEIERIQRRRSGLKREIPSKVRDYLEVAKLRGFAVTSLDNKRG
jgi:hypothetical protein